MVKDTHTRRRRRRSRLVQSVKTIDEAAGQHIFSYEMMIIFLTAFPYR